MSERDAIEVVEDPVTESPRPDGARPLNRASITQALQPERGQALLEFALFLPVVLILMLAILDFGIAVDRKEVLDHAVREATRRAALGASVTEVAAQAADQSDGLIEPADVAVCYEDIDGNGGPGDAGDSVRVQISHNYGFVLGSEVDEAFGVGAPSVEISPVAEARLEDSVGVAPEC